MVEYQITTTAPYGHVLAAVARKITERTHPENFPTVHMPVSDKPMASLFSLRRSNSTTYEIKTETVPPEIMESIIKEVTEQLSGRE